MPTILTKEEIRDHHEHPHYGEEYYWGLAIYCKTKEEGDKVRNTILQNQKIREFVEARLKIAEYEMDQYVKNPHEKKTKQEAEAYWQAVAMFKILTDILEESKQ